MNNNDFHRQVEALRKECTINPFEVYWAEVGEPEEAYRERINELLSLGKQWKLAHNQEGS